LRNFIFLLRKSYLGERVTFGWLFSFTLTQRRTFNMPNTVTALAQMADQAATRITVSHKSWTDFLKNATRFDRSADYPYHRNTVPNTVHT
jgi:hypothetical protein